MTEKSRADTNPKAERYVEVFERAEAVLAGEDDPVAWMATLACLIQGEFGFLWAGFYRVRGQELVIGPYQGTLGCLRIPFERGVCGACARQRKTLVVEDVHAFPGHISCDARSRSEIVIPVLDDAGRLHAVLDIDSDEPGSFDEIDREGLERLTSRMKGLRWTVPY